MQGLVLRTTGSWYRVKTLQGDILDCRLRGNYRLRGNKQTNPIAVGDNVEFSLQEDGTGLISDVLDRRNYIVRRATKLSKQTHVVAANIDLLCIVATVGFPRTSTGFIDRLLVTAEAYHIPACLILNKVDLYGSYSDGRWYLDPEQEESQLHQYYAELYRQVGYPVLEVSAQKGYGVDAVREMMKDKTVLFSGHSGVGKSALLNALDPNLDLRVGEVSDWSLKGKHTTTFAELFPFAGGYLIDSPGIKEFGIVDFRGEELSHFFPEMRQLLHQCHFSTCTHTHEPHCAIKQAVEEGTIAEERYINYLNILKSINE